ncbi:ROK family transcriptional regulator [Thermoactinomyces mirandus]|uniref:ROK family protein n=1 Tax=Thermoactinomyces mirandus TaxID=2756294 RepID=A0A7W2AQZ7_9BACL|nr:ROK family protein [Thermoactinomyces mirandus]MBA4602033.1 ROK family protein [Thermoactinomyces mirandus]
MKRLRTGDQNLVKQINKSIVFNTIKKKGPLSRAQVSKKTGLNKATVSTMVSELINEAFIHEIGAGKSSGGRKPVMLYFNHRAGYAVGIDVGVNYILGVLTDLSGNVIEKTASPLRNIDIDYVVGQIFSCIETLVNNVPNSPYGIVGVGIGVPGQVGQDDQILFAPNLKWRNIHLKQMVEKKFLIPAKIGNEANAGAYGEQLYGAGKNISNLVYVSIGIGIGTGIFINNRLYKGATGISGEMGHFTIDFNGKKCSCGNRGCWELYASESALLQEASQQKLLNENDESNLDFLFREAQKGNSQVLKLLNILGENIGFGLINIMNTFNPETIIIGNRIARFKNWIKKPIERILEERLPVYHQSNTDIRFSMLGDDSTALGAASFAISSFFLNRKITDRLESIS